MFPGSAMMKQMIGFIWEGARYATSMPGVTDIFIQNALSGFSLL